MNVEEAKKAILCALVSPDIRTVLIQGVSGSAKTTLVRAIPGICDIGIVNLPLNATEGQVIGSLDLEETISKGQRNVLPGLISRASGNILYGDDCNLIDHSILSTVLKAAHGSEVYVEREGMSWDYVSDMRFIGTMNLLEDQMNAHLMDMFDLCVRVGHTDNEHDRYEIVRRRMEFDRSPEEFRASYREDENAVRSKMDDARVRIPFVSISDGLLGVIVELSSKLGVEGHRGDIALVNASKALAALDGRDDVTLDDVKEAAGMCLGHRMTTMPPDESEGSSEQGQEPPESSPNMSPSESSGGSEGHEEGGDSGSGDNETVFSIGNTFSVIDFMSSAGLKQNGSVGKHGKTKSNDNTGRYVRSRMSSDMTDIALDASIRAAAPYQRYRKSDNGLALILEPEDLRRKVRERKSGASVMFLVDASGSMGARKRMVAVKGAVFSLLQESYKNRDKVGLTAFRRDTAEVLLPFTKSVDFAYRKLKDLPTGGTTPLAAALLKAYTEVQREMRSKPNERYYVVVTTDGRANVPMSGGDAFSDAMKAARHIGAESDASWIVVDTGTGYPHTDNALKICRELNGTYLKLEELNADALAFRIKTIVNSRGRA